MPLRNTSTMLDTILQILAFVVALGILVLVHEWGHFIVARKSGIRVEKFSIGFGPKLLGFTRGGTEYRVALLPLGGYVKLYGEDPMAEAEGDEAKAKAIAASPDAFSSKPISRRLPTVFAGPFMNLLLSFLIMPVVFMVGRMTPAILDEKPVILGIMKDSPASQADLAKGDRILSMDGKKMDSWSDVINWVILHPDSPTHLVLERNGEQRAVNMHLTTSPFIKEQAGYAGFEPHFFWGNEAIVGGILPGKPADKAGIKVGDQIISIDNQVIDSWTEMTNKIEKLEGKEVAVALQRGDETVSTTVKPVYDEDSKAWRVGISKYTSPNTFVKKRYAFGEAIQRGFSESWKLLKLTFEVIGRLFTFNLSYKSLGGPIQIAKASGDAAKAGFGEFLYFMAFLSMQLGVLNLLPIPVLDGGHVLFMTIEAIRRKPLSLQVRNTLTYMGLILLLTLMVVVTFNDIDRIWGFSDMFGKVKGIF